MALGRRGIERGRLLVVAGAGYGKSTFVAQVAARGDLPLAWCSCDARMRSPAALFAHLRAAVESAVPGFGADLCRSGQLDRLVADFCNELVSTVASELVLVLDDVHELDGSECAAAIAAIHRDLPASVGLVIVGRTRPDGVNKASILARGVEIDDHALAFSAEEVGALVGEVSATRAADLHAATEGWPAGVVLGSQTDVHEEGLGPEGREALFEVLVGEVLDGLSADLVDFLERTAVLGRFTPEIAGQVSERTNAEGACHELLGRHLFTTRITGPGQWYRYHQLLREYLLERIGDEARRDAERRAADAWLAAGEPLEAVEHLLRAGDPGAALDVLEPIATDVARSPEGPVLDVALREAGEGAWSDRARLVLGRATRVYRTGGYEESFALAERGIAAAIADGDDGVAATALIELMQNMLVAGTPPSRRVAAGAPLLDQLDPSPLRSVARIWLVPGLAFGGERARAAEELRRARAEGAGSHLPVGPYADVMEGFYIEFPSGRPERALHLLDGAARALAELGPAGDPHAMRVYALAYRPYVLNSMGRFAQALEASAETVSCMRDYRLEVEERASRWWRMTALAGLGRWDQLEQELAPPASPTVPREITHYGYRYRAPIALLSAARGDVGEVAAQVNAALDEVARHGASPDHPWILCDLFNRGSAGRARLCRRFACGPCSRRGAPDGPAVGGRSVGALRGADPSREGRWRSASRGGA